MPSEHGYLLYPDDAREKEKATMFGGGGVTVLARKSKTTKR